MGCCNHSVGGSCGACATQPSYRAPLGGRMFMGGAAAIVAPFRNQMSAPVVPPFYATAPALARSSGALTRYRPSGAIGDLPGGLTPEQWFRLTPAQQADLTQRETTANARQANAEARGVARESATAERALEAQRIREVALGFTMAATTVRDVWQNQQDQETERLRIQAGVEIARYGAQQQTERARIAAASGISTISPATTSTAATTTPTTMPTWQMVAIGAVLLGGGYYIVTANRR